MNKTAISQTQVTEIEIVPVKAENGLVAFANCVLDNKFFLGNIAVYTRLNARGFRCVYPTKKLANGQQIQLYYPINQEVSRAVESVISERLSELLSGGEISKSSQEVENYGTKNI